ncbi:SurA N-terminal domain-containing protein [Oceanisphaera arctica]|uniref:Periplasmic chaperone PpiD n=1 Tax=Oceanisphaera arctica TaxID=641510 RepID=A0A2P5TRU5_9GAMM|nr:SurA N-terminal domain-containing protein [Oceanisphaera arctica]PPL18549.1 peptidylprolyl isomerase [Oceanisphaera arctica]GHA17291.1 peptidylprolyl isomerase [Oceanisphaera arctica]
MFFDKLRAGAQGTVSKVILVLIILSFALAGVGSYVTRPTAEVAAVVNGDDIGAQALENAYRNERTRLENQLGPQFSQLLGDPQYVAQIRRSVLEQMVEQRLIDQKVQELGLYASDEQVRNAIRALPEFQQDGRFDNERYLQLLSRTGMSAEQLRDNVRQDLSRQLLLNALIGSGFSLEAEAGWLDRLNRQQRDAELVRLPLAEFSTRVELTEDQVKAYYQQQPQQFQRPEQVKVDYLLLDANAVTASDIDEQAIEAEYQANLTTYSQPEQRKVAHIMVNKGDSAEQEIKAISERLAAGESFAELAQAESDDVFSGAQGGELEWMEQGTLDPVFDQAAFALTEAGEVSPVVESEFGLHLITLLEKRDSKTKPLAEVRDTIAERLAQEQAANAFYEQEQRLAELAFEFPDSLDMAAQELDLNVTSTDYFSAEDAPAAFNDSRVLTQAFSADLREQGMNSELIELGSNKALVIHVTDYRPAAVRDFDEVRELAREQTLAARARELTEQAAVELQQAWAAGEQQAWLERNGLAVTELKDVTRESEQDPAVLDALFAMPAPQDEPSLHGLALAGGDQMVLKLNAVSTPEQPSELLAQIRQGQSGLQGQREYLSLIGALKASAKIEYRQLTAQNDNF